MPRCRADLSRGYSLQEILTWLKGTHWSLGWPEDTKPNEETFYLDGRLSSGGRWWLTARYPGDRIIHKPWKIADPVYFGRLTEQASEQRSRYYDKLQEVKRQARWDYGPAWEEMPEHYRSLFDARGPVLWAGKPDDAVVVSVAGNEVRVLASQGDLTPKNPRRKSDPDDSMSQLCRDVEWADYMEQVYWPAMQRLHAPEYVLRLVALQNRFNHWRYIAAVLREDRDMALGFYLPEPPPPTHYEHDTVWEHVALVCVRLPENGYMLLNSPRPLKAANHVCPSSPYMVMSKNPPQMHHLNFDPDSGEPLEPYRAPGAGESNDS